MVDLVNECLSLTPVAAVVINVTTPTPAFAMEALMTASPNDTLPALLAEVAETDKRISRLQARLSKLRERYDEARSRYQDRCRKFAFGDAEFSEQFLNESQARRVEVEVVEKELDQLCGQRERFYCEQVAPLQQMKAKTERKQRIEDLRRAHECDAEKERQCERELAEARDRTNRSYFAWRVEVDQESIAEQEAALDKAKREWALRSGPNAVSPRVSTVTIGAQ